MNPRAMTMMENINKKILKTRRMRKIKETKTIRRTTTAQARPVDEST